MDQERSAAPVESARDEGERPPSGGGRRGFAPQKKGQAGSFSAMLAEEEQKSAPKYGFGPKGGKAVVPFSALLEEEATRSVPAPKPKPKPTQEVEKPPRAAGGDEDHLFWGTAEPVAAPASTEEDWPSLDALSQPSRGGPKGKSDRERKIEWLASALMNEVGGDDWEEFAGSLVQKTRSEMTKFLATVTDDHQQAVLMADAFFRRFPT
jgi:hypothetical protein